MKTRIETDSMGKILVEDSRYWGAQTQRALEHFAISDTVFPMPFIHSYALVKKACAHANFECGVLEESIRDTIVTVCDEIQSGKWDSEFPLPIWQSGSGTQTNMNLNEVISNRAIEILGGVKGSRSPVHPNDHVNKSQSTNDTFPTVMHVSTVLLTQQRLLPALEALIRSLAQKQDEFQGIIKIGRTHLQDATPLTLGQEFSAYRFQLEECRGSIQAGLAGLAGLALGGTAVGTGLNTPRDFAERAIGHIAVLTAYPFVPMTNRFSGLAAHDALVRFAAGLNSLAVALFKIANDIRWLGSGPRCGLGELLLPENEPGSSIMPGKVNPSQAEALTMVCARVMGHFSTVTLAGASGNFELNVFKPVLIHSILDSIALLGDAMAAFSQHCVEGIQANQKRIDYYLDNSLMLVTALNPHIGYDKAAAIAKNAYEQNLTLKEAAVKSGWLTEEEFDNWIQPRDMLGH